MAKEDDQSISFYKGEPIYKENDKPDSAYLIQRGSVVIYRMVEDKKEIQTTAKAGQIFGEIEIIRGGRRGFSAEAEEYCTLIKIERKTLKTIFKDSLPIVKILIEQLAEQVRSQEKLVQQLKQKEKIADHFISLGKGVPGEEESYFMKKSFHKGETIFKEGEESNCAYRVKSGVVELYKFEHDQNIMQETLKGGDMFGELGVISGNPRQFTAKASEYCELEKIDRPTLKNLVRDSHPVIKGITKKIVERINFLEDNVTGAKLYQTSFMSFCAFFHLLVTGETEEAEETVDQSVSIKGKAAASKKKDVIVKTIQVNDLEKEIKDILLKLRGMKLVEISNPDPENPNIMNVSILDAKRFLRKAQKAYDKYMQEKMAQTAAATTP